MTCNRDFQDAGRTGFHNVLRRNRSRNGNTVFPQASLTTLQLIKVYGADRETTRHATARRKIRSIEEKHVCVPNHEAEVSTSYVERSNLSRSA